MSILHKPVSYYPSIKDTNAGTIVTLIQILRSSKHHDVIQRLRSESDSIIQKQLKESLPCYTVAGVFNGRSNGSITQPSGLAAIDLDSAEAYDPIQILKELHKIPYIAYCGLSCRGKRLFAIIPILYPEKYLQHYDRLIRSFNDIGLPMGDHCHRSISQPRLVSYNTEATEFFNHSAPKYSLLEPLRTIYIPNNYTNEYKTYTPTHPFNWCVSQINKRHSFIENSRHHYILQLARYCNMKGIEENTTLTGCLQFKCADFKETEITAIVRHVYRKQRDSHNTIPFNAERM
jgi:hypothetical protein